MPDHLTGCVIIALFVIAKERSDCGNLAITMGASTRLLRPRPRNDRERPGRDIKSGATVL